MGVYSHHLEIVLPGDSLHLFSILMPDAEARSWATHVSAICPARTEPWVETNAEFLAWKIWPKIPRNLVLEFLIDLILNRFKFNKKLLVIW